MAVPVPAGRGIDVSVTIHGLNVVTARLAGMKKVAKLALGHAMKVEMEGVIQLAQDQFVPVDTGKLKASGRVRGPMYPTSMAIEVWGSFGPVKNPRGSGYSVPVHEIPEPPATSVGGRSAHHDWGTWHYLTLPFLIRQPTMVARIMAEFNLMLVRLGLPTSP